MVIQDLLSKKENILYEDQELFAAFPESAACKGHIVIAPKKPAKTIDVLSPELVENLFSCSNMAATTLFESLGAQGTNIISTEGGDEGFFINVIARMPDDGLNFQWSPKQLSPGELDGLVSSISEKMVMDEPKQKPDHPPVIEDKNVDSYSDEDDDELEETYLVKQLNRVP